MPGHFGYCSLDKKLTKHSLIVVHWPRTFFTVKVPNHFRSLCDHIYRNLYQSFETFFKLCCTNHFLYVNQNCTLHQLTPHTSQDLLNVSTLFHYALFYGRGFLFAKPCFLISLAHFLILWRHV